VTRASSFTLHEFVPAHLPELVDLWIESWQQTMPAIDFEARRSWFVDHLNGLRDSGGQVVCAFDAGGAMAGFVTIDPAAGLLDQIAVATCHWGSSVARALLDEAKRRSPAKVWLDVNQDNTRAVRFYEKNGFIREAASVNPRSGLKTWRYRWPAPSHGRA
jgi:putative acetyltransferase